MNLTQSCGPIWVTRAQPGAARTAAALRALGWEAVAQPLIETRALETTIDLAGVGALAFTSTAAVALFAARSDERALPVFAVGAATAGAARSAGFSRVECADGDIADLARLIVGWRTDFANAVLHPGAREPAGDLSGALSAAGLETRAIALYETVPAALPESFVGTLDRFAAVTLHSPSAARALAALEPPPALLALCLSEAVAAPVRAAGLEVRVAARPDEASLMALLSRR